MNESEERVYIQGERRAWATMLDDCLKNLGYNGDENERIGWITEREEAISVLRRLCADYGDNDWDENLSLADILTKHLEDYLAHPP